MRGSVGRGAKRYPLNPAETGARTPRKAGNALPVGLEAVLRPELS